MSLFRIANRLATFGVKLAYSSILGRQIYLVPHDPTEKADQLTQKLYEVPWGSPQFHQLLKEINKLGVESGLDKQRENNAATFASRSGSFGHFYWLTKILEHPKIDSEKAIRDPMLMYYYLIGIPGYCGVLHPQHHKELIEKLKKATRKEYLELLRTKEYKDAFDFGTKEMKQDCASADLIPKGLVAILMKDMVEVLGHIITEEVNALLLQTVSDHHTFDPGLSLHMHTLGARNIVFQNIGRGRAYVPVLWNTLNNITAGVMWSLSPIPGFTLYIADKAGIQNVEEWLVKEKYKQAIDALDILRLLGNGTGPINHALVDASKLAELGATTEVLAARDAALWESQNPFEEIKTIEQDIKTIEEAKRLARQLTGEVEVDPRSWYSEPQQGTIFAPDERKGGGIFDEVQKLGDVDLNFGTGIDYAIFPFVQEPKAKWNEPLKKVIDEAMAKHMTPQTMLTLKAKYNEELNKVISGLSLEDQAQPKAIELAIQTSIILRVLVESELFRIRDLLAPEIGEKLINEQKINLALDPMSLVMRSVYDRFEVEVKDYFFSKDGPVQTWNERRIYEHVISPDIEKLMSDRRAALAQEKQAHIGNLAAFDAIHDHAMVEKSEKLKKERELINDKRERTEQAHSAMEKNMEESKNWKLESGKREKDLKEREMKYQSKWNKK